jgi:phytoene desaturase
LKLLKKTKEIFDVGFTQLGDVPFDSMLSMLKVAPAMIKLGTWRTVWQMACKYIENDKLRRVFSFQPLLVGGNPFNTTSIYSLIQYLEREWGVHFAMGGTGAIVAGLEKLMREERIEIRLGEEVERIDLIDHRIQMRRARFLMFTAAGVTLRGGEFLSLENKDRAYDQDQFTSIVVCNADTPNAYSRLMPDFYHMPATSKPKWTAFQVNQLKFSMGLFVLYFGTTRRYPDVAHHTIILGDRYKSLLHEMFDLKQLEMSDFSVYLHRPTATDPSMAPAGCDSFYVLVPVPNLQGGQDWKSIGDDYRNRVVQFLERTHLPGLSQCITEDFYVTPEHFRDNLNTMHGTGFSIQPTFTQSAYFRFHNKSEDIAGLYFVGAGTHPGAGMPGVLCSAKVLDRIVPDPTG